MHHSAWLGDFIKQFVFNRSVHTESAIPCDTPIAEPWEAPVNEQCWFSSRLFFVCIALNGGENYQFGV
jgi:hypothetical protein